MDGTCDRTSGASDLFRVGRISVVVRQFVQAQLGRSSGDKVTSGDKTASGSKAGRMDI
jgi:hypothetical protein